MTTSVAKNPRVISCLTADVSVNLAQAGDFIFDYQSLTLYLIGQNGSGLKTLQQVNNPAGTSQLIATVTNGGVGAIAQGEWVEPTTATGVQKAGTIGGPVSGVALGPAAPGAQLQVAFAGIAKVKVGAVAFGPRVLLTVDTNSLAVAATALTTPTPPAIEGSLTHALSLIPGVPGQLCDVMLCLNGTRPGTLV